MLLRFLKEYLAVEQGIIQRNPTPDIRFRKGDKIKQGLNESQVRLLLERAKDLECEWYPVWSAALYTGMRSGELFAVPDWSYDCRQIPLRNDSMHRFRNDRDWTERSWGGSHPIAHRMSSLTWKAIVVHGCKLLFFSLPLRWVISVPTTTMDKLGRVYDRTGARNDGYERLVLYIWRCSCSRPFVCCRRSVSPIRPVRT